jgi:hypothetical protein
MSWNSYLFSKPKKGAKMRARKSHPITSHEAGEQVKNLTETKKAILVVLSNGDMVDTAIYNEYLKLILSNKAPMASESGIRARRSELVTDGLVEGVGFGKTIFGRRCIIWGLSRGEAQG